LSLVVHTSAIDCLERLISEMTRYVSSGTLALPQHGVPRPWAPRQIICNGFLKISKPIFCFYGNKSKTCRLVFGPYGGERVKPYTLTKITQLTSTDKWSVESVDVGVLQQLLQQALLAASQAGNTNTKLLSCLSQPAVTSVSSQQMLPTLIS